MTDEPIDLDKIRRDCRQTTWLIHADQALVPLTTARRHALDLCDEIERLRERGIRYDDAIEKLRGDWAGERDKVLALQARIDAVTAQFQAQWDEAVEAATERDALQARLDDAHALLRRWSGGLVPVGDYMLRADTDAALTEESS